ncbi:hypothetical protein VMCG_07166 [Cytospora schulzeri]|uniref:Glutathione S-transferase n=1 Tax=Cytospora schulzeri TaxID=448051 RepID=A0A423W4Z2_9PEZI|nr:hypothetical protein VMCG_07166 [Valsa malicola]
MATPPADKAPKPGLNIYGFVAVNPYKLTIAAEELGIPYNYILLDHGAGDFQSEWYLAINPNGRVPAIVHVKEDGTSVAVFESGPCLMYIASEFGKDGLSYMSGTQEYWTQLSWLSWQIAGYGPMMGQATHFNRYSVEPVPYGAWRYTAESRRLNHVLNTRLSESPFLAGDRLTIADIAVFIFADSTAWCGINIDEFPHVKAWHDKLLQRPAFQRGLNAPRLYPFSNRAVVDPDNQEFCKIIRSGASKTIKAASDQWKGEPFPLPSDHANLE